LRARFVIAVAVVGLLLNLTGWAGNVFLLGPMWDRAVSLAPPPMRSPFGGVVHVLLQFFSDFVFAFVWCLVYRLASPGWNRPGLKLALVSAGIVWLGGVPMCYLGMVNGGYLPLDISVATTLLALLTFVLVAPLLPRLLPGRDAGS
jgi:hypothetical protein